MIDSIEFLQVEINALAVAFGDMLLRLCHRLMGRPPWPEPVADCRRQGVCGTDHRHVLCHKRTVPLGCREVRIPLAEPVISSISVAILRDSHKVTLTNNIGSFAGPGQAPTGTRIGQPPQWVA